MGSDVFATGSTRNRSMLNIAGSRGFGCKIIIINKWMMMNDDCDNSVVSFGCGFIALSMFSSWVSVSSSNNNNVFCAA